MSGALHVGRVLQPGDALVVVVEALRALVARGLELVELGHHRLSQAADAGRQLLGVLVQPLQRRSR